MNRSTVLAAALALSGLLAMEGAVAGENVTAAIANLSCAPWDGRAFHVAIPLDMTTSTRVVDVSIWQAPNLSRKASFSFPDATQQVGAAGLETHAGAYETLAGTVTFRSAEAGKPVEGSFDFITPSGEKIHRAFRATWGTERPLCG